MVATGPDGDVQPKPRRSAVKWSSANLMTRPVRSISVFSFSVFLAVSPAFADTPAEALAPLVTRLQKGGQASYSYALRQYNRVESSRRLDVFGRYEVHKGILKALRGQIDKDLLAVTRGLIKKRTSSVYPSQVVALKAFSGSVGAWVRGRLTEPSVDIG